MKLTSHNYFGNTGLRRLLLPSLLFISFTQFLVADEVTPAPKPKGWESVASVGVTLTRGNSRTFLATGSLNSTRKWTEDEVLLGASGGYGETTSRDTGLTSKTDDYLKGFGQWNHLFTPRFYGGIRLDGVHDDIADLDYRFTASPLAGYYLIKQTNVTLSAEAGPSFIYEKQGGKEHSYVGARIGDRFEYKLQGGAKIWQTAEWIPQVDKFDNWILNAEVGVSAPLSKAFDVRLVAQDTFDNEPAPGRMKNDFKLIAAIGYRF